MMESEEQANREQLEAQVSGFARLGALNEHRNTTSYPDRLDDRIDALREHEADSVLSIEVERVVRIVLCTGGPHCEIRWVEGDRYPTVVCFGWFGKDRVERELTSDEIAGLEMALGDWETLAMVES